MKKYLLLLLILSVMLALAAKFLLWPKPPLSQNQTDSGVGINPKIQTRASNATDSVASTSQTYTNDIFCYSIAYPAAFNITTTTEGLANLKNYDASVELHEAASPPGIGIQIQHANLPASTTLDEFIQKENAAIAADNQNALPEDALNSTVASTSIGVFRYSEETFAGPGGKFTSFLSPTLDGAGYYSVLVWNKEINEAVVKTILEAFTPSECQSLATSTP